MKMLSRFVTKFTGLIVAVLPCFDRVIFNGYLPITNGNSDTRKLVERTFRTSQVDYFRITAPRARARLVEGRRDDA
jgi:hypothetical protein